MTHSIGHLWLPNDVQKYLWLYLSCLWWRQGQHLSLPVYLSFNLATQLHNAPSELLRRDPTGWCPLEFHIFLTLIFPHTGIATDGLNNNNNNNNNSNNNTCLPVTMMSSSHISALMAWFVQKWRLMHHLHGYSLSVHLVHLTTDTSWVIHSSFYDTIRYDTIQQKSLKWTQKLSVISLI